jgi:hypothetical protein
MNLLTYLSIAYQFTIGLSESQYQLWEPIDRPYGVQYSRTSLETDFNIKAYFWRFYITGGVNVTSQKEIGAFAFDAGKYNPLANDYPYGAGYSGKFFDVGYEYRCIHPTLAYLQDRDIKKKKDGAYSFVFVKFHHELRFAKNQKE